MTTSFDICGLIYNVMTRIVFVSCQELQSVTSERDGLKAKLKKTELDLEQIKTENQGFREERDRLRRRVGA